MGQAAKAIGAVPTTMPAFERALKSGRTCLLELQVDPKMITTRTTLTAIREASLAKQ